jgi:hypothetical protein
METEEPVNQVEETPLKPKRTRKVSEEQKIVLADRMRKVNEDRIAKAKAANVAELDIKEQKMKEKLEKIVTKKEAVTKPKVKKEEPVAPVAPVAPTQVKEKKVRKVYVEESESEEEEIVYVTKPKAKPKAPVAQPKATVPQEPKVIFKFI